MYTLPYRYKASLRNARKDMRFLTKSPEVMVLLKISTSLNSFAIILRLTHFAVLDRQLQTLFFLLSVTSEMNILLTLLTRNVLQEYVNIFSALKLSVTSVSAVVCVLSSVLHQQLQELITLLLARSLLQCKSILKSA